MGVDPIRMDKWYEKLFFFMLLWAAGVFNFIRGTMGYKPNEGDSYRELYQKRQKPKWYRPLAFETVPVAPVHFHYRGGNSREAARYLDKFRAQYSSLPVKVVHCDGMYYVV